MIFPSPREHWILKHLSFQLEATGIFYPAFDLWTFCRSKLNRLTQPFLASKHLRQLFPLQIQQTRNLFEILSLDLWWCRRAWLYQNCWSIPQCRLKFISSRLGLKLPWVVFFLIPLIKIFRRFISLIDSGAVSLLQAILHSIFLPLRLWFLTSRILDWVWTSPQFKKPYPLLIPLLLSKISLMDSICPKWAK